MSTQIEKIKKFVRATNYLTATQIYLKENHLLDNPLTFDNIKPRLLGHWGTCPGINFVYAQLNNLIINKQANMLFTLGPGHGFPALQANVFMEGTLGKYYPEATRDEKGISYISKKFSWPYGFPSHASPATPGVILEGGELGYSLSTSYGAVLDNPDLVVACLVGDGEAETGPLATSWHLSKLIDPTNDGAVLPILHLNGYKISGPTFFGRMNNKDLKALFTGYGYEPHIVDAGTTAKSEEKVYETMAATLEKCYEDIRSIQKAAREGTLNRDNYPRFPMIVFRSPKGWTGIKKMEGIKYEGNSQSHQVVGKEMKKDKVQLKALDKWLRSYKFEELFDQQKGFDQDILDLVPPENLRMGDNPIANGLKDKSQDLRLPDEKVFMEDATVPGTIGSSSMRRIGAYLNDVFKLNAEKKNFRLMSPDETYSNKLDEVFQTTKRVFAGPIEKWDTDLAHSGRVMEMLSEHSMQGLLQGYVLTGRNGVFCSYEAFVQIVASMADQYSKFLKVARDVSWRGDIPSFNYILTSSGWRQEHNGFSHQNPGFIETLLLKHNNFVSVFFPPDGNSALATIKRCLAAKNEINIIVAEKTVEPRWLTPAEAETQVKQGIMTWTFASDATPDIVIGTTGQYTTKEALAAIEIIKAETPSIKVRLVNISELSPNTIGSSTGKMPLSEFEKYFTADKPVIFNFHGYPETLKQSLFDYENTYGRFSVHGYIETGSTSTPLDLHMRNKTSRYDLAIEAWRKMADAHVIERFVAEEKIAIYEEKMKQHKTYIIESGIDPEEIENWVWSGKGR